jgi:hypothetical protein
VAIDMANLFDTANAPTGEPNEIIAGDLLQFKITNLVTDYDPSLYTLTYTARISGQQDEIQFSATNDSSSYLISVPGSTTSSWSPGEYNWQQEIIRNSDSARITLKRGEFKVIADLDNNAVDNRSHSQIMVDKIESLLQGKADSDVSTYSVAGRSLTKLSFQELLDARNFYKSEVIKEKSQLDAKNGRKGSATVQVRF